MNWGFGREVEGLGARHRVDRADLVPHHVGDNWRAIVRKDDDVMSVEHFYVFKARRGAASGHENESRGTARSLRDASLRAAGVLP